MFEGDIYLNSNIEKNERTKLELFAWGKKVRKAFTK